MTDRSERTLAMVPYRYAIACEAGGDGVIDIFVDSGLVGWNVAFPITAQQARALAAQEGRPLALREALHPHLADRHARPRELFPPETFAHLCDIAAFAPPGPGWRGSSPRRSRRSTCRPSAGAWTMPWRGWRTR